MEYLHSLMTQEFLGKEAWLWVGFLGLIVVLMAMDLGLFRKEAREISFRESLTMYGFYMFLAMLFGAWVWYRFGSEAGAAYYTGYFIEQSLSMDNLFVMSLIFMHLAVPRSCQHRVLFWGILGVIILRGLMIGVGVWVIEHFHWVLMLFGGFLIYTGIRMLFQVEDEEEINFEEHKVLRFLTKRMRVTMTMDGDKFFIREDYRGDGKIILCATPIFLALCLIEISDVIFAVDSIPAIFVITTDPYIIFTSNLFAILGLRSLYFGLSAIMHRFVYVKYSLAVVLTMIGAEIFYNHFFGKVDTVLTLAATLLLLIVGIGASLLRPEEKKSST